jgi:hypothetical protein
MNGNRTRLSDLSVYEVDARVNTQLAGRRPFALPLALGNFLSLILYTHKRAPENGPNQWYVGQKKTEGANNNRQQEERDLRRAYKPLVTLTASEWVCLAPGIPTATKGKGQGKEMIFVFISHTHSTDARDFFNTSHIYLESVDAFKLVKLSRKIRFLVVRKNDTLK